MEQESRRKEEMKISDNSELEMKKRVLDRKTFNECSLVIIKLKMVMGTRCLKSILFIEALLERIKKTKQAFLYQVEKGAETFIPHDLS